ncbi:MAG TPA: hypothetical protein VJ672_04555 [Gemmatimonadaceae bacterium]|nr:hypothetical protein [Gemmatimonadaceae bacterium]
MTTSSQGAAGAAGAAGTAGSAGAELDSAVAEYRETANIARLLQRLDAIADSTDPDTLIAAAEAYRDIPEVSGPLYERVVDARPHDARALVILANAYWLSGRGPEVVSDLASRAIAADPSNRGAWHLWALSEPSPRERTARWQQVTERFPTDDLAKANLADNAASLASAESDSDALALAIATYESLLNSAEREEQRIALGKAIETLRGWTF